MRDAETLLTQVMDQHIPCAVCKLRYKHQDYMHWHKTFAGYVSCIAHRIFAIRMLDTRQPNRDMLSMAGNLIVVEINTITEMVRQIPELIGAETEEEFKSTLNRAEADINNKVETRINMHKRLLCEAKPSC